MYKVKQAVVLKDNTYGIPAGTQGVIDWVGRGKHGVIVDGRKAPLCFFEHELAPKASPTFTGKLTAPETPDEGKGEDDPNILNIFNL